MINLVRLSILFIIIAVPNILNGLSFWSFRLFNMKPLSTCIVIHNRHRCLHQHIWLGRCIIILWTVFCQPCFLRFTQRANVNKSVDLYILSTTSFSSTLKLKELLAFRDSWYLKFITYEHFSLVPATKLLWNETVLHWYLCPTGLNKRFRVHWYEYTCTLVYCDNLQSGIIWNHNC